jgi:hypothetical protein
MRLKTVTNYSEVSLEMAVWLMQDSYDHVKTENYISATALMKPVRQIVLPPRIPLEEQLLPNVENFIPTAIGTALHESIERAWLNPEHVEQALRKLGYPESMIERIRVNPTKKQLEVDPEIIPIYVEQRSIREVVIDNVTFKVGGKFDMVCDGRVTDTKSSSVWSWIHGRRDKEHQLQGSIYRWLNPKKITEDHIRINYIFTDWNKSDARQPNYPDKRIKHLDIPLLTLEETEAWIRAKLKQVLTSRQLEEAQLPECTPEELWMSPSKFKYYSNPASTTGKSTRNFDTLLEANAFLQEKGKGVVIAVSGSPRRCGYCNAFPICTQKDKYRHD